MLPPPSMNMLEPVKSMVVLHNVRKGNNYLVAQAIGKHFNCGTCAAEDNPSLANFDLIFIVVSNIGDEELPQPMEDYLFNLRILNKKYVVCELGNYFGFENYCGCKSVVIKLLDFLGWTKLADISLDSLPTLDEDGLIKWLETLRLI